MLLRKSYLIILFTLISQLSFSQQKVNVADALMRTAQSHMGAGRYGEAIDQLNKYIAALPQDPVGYYLQAQCLEKRQSYENARVQYRRAVALQKDGALRARYEQDLQKMLTYWYALLNKKIVGHRREIDINPNLPFNYLEIGKCYSWMEIWDKAEQWYDEYLMRDDNASPDEIIRYSIILAKTGSIVKGERILKKYTTRYPQDWRLWSGYGYFTLWLGKNQIAKKAFETALAYKPFFKEAEEGLDFVNQQAYLVQSDPRAYEKEFPIDRYYRLLRRRSGDTETRFKLIDELIKANRIEEAYEQLKIASVLHSEDERYKTKWTYVTAYRDSLYRVKLEGAKATLRQNEYDKEALKTVANYYDFLQNYDSAMVMLDKYFENVLQKRPNDLHAIIAKASSVLTKQDFEKAQELADKAKDIDPNDDDVIKLQSNIDWQKMRAVEEKLYAILELGRQRVQDGDPSGAIQYYEEYMGKAEPNDLIKKEFGDVLFAAKDYKRSLETYNQVLAQGDNYPAQMQRAKLYYSMGDSVSALHEFKELVKKDSADFEANLYLGDSYAKIAEDDSARAVYNMLLETWQLDSTQTQMVTQRKGWLPITGIQAIIQTFPNYIGLAPSVQYYADNLSFRLLATGARLDLGLTRFLSFGVSFARQQLKANAAVLTQSIIDTIPNFYADQRFTTFKGHVFVRFSDQFNMGVGIGKSSSQGLFSRDEQDAFFKFERRDTASVTLQYQNSDASLILYSPYLISIRQMARLYKIQGYYRHRDGMKIEGTFQYIGVDDGNEGNNFNLRLGRYFYKDLAIGYEYAYDNFKWKSSYYYSPRNFESHSIWIDNELDRKENLRITIGGKLGIIPQGSLIVLEGHFDGEYKPIKNLLIACRIGIGSTSRDNESYRYFSGQLSAYWTIF